MKTHWLLVRTKAGRERYAARNVARQNVQGVETFLPYFEDAKFREVPFFPAYLFVRTPGPFMFLENTYGVTSIIRFGERPGIVPHSVIRELKKLTKDSQRPLVKRRVRYQYDKGAALKVTEGPFASHVGLYSRTTPEKRICILLEIMSKQVPLELDADQVTLAQAA